MKVAKRAKLFNCQTIKNEHRDRFSTGVEEKKKRVFILIKGIVHTSR